MSCPAERLAAAFPSLPADLEDHVAGCAPCSDAWGGYRALADLVSALPEPEPPTTFEVRRARRALVASARLQAAAVLRQRVEDRAARRLGPDRTPRRLAGLAAAAVLVAGGSLLSSPLGPRREARVADGPRGVDQPGGVPIPGEGAAADPGPPRLAPRPAGAPSAAGADGEPSGPAPGLWAPEAPETWPESIQAPAPPDSEGRRLTLHELRERWAFVGIGPSIGGPAGPRTAPRTAAPFDRSSNNTVAAGRVGLPGRPSPPGSDGAGGDSPTGGAGPRDPDLSPGEPDDRPEDPDDEATCGDLLANRFTECLIENGLDPAHPDESEETAAIASACWQDAAATAQGCCASTPDASCEEPTREPETGQGGESCADVLFAENDRCLADSGIADPSNPVTEADHEIVSYCWIDVANGAFDACCAANPDSTCP